MILGKPYNRLVDLWALGCFVYELLSGYPPFKNKDRNALFQSILKVNVTYPYYLSEVAISFIKGLLCFTPTQRLGSRGFREIKNHAFFHGIEWKAVWEKRQKAPILPTIKSKADVSNFDKVPFSSRSHSHVSEFCGTRPTLLRKSSRFLLMGSPSSKTLKVGLGTTCPN